MRLRVARIWLRDPQRPQQRFVWPAAILRGHDLRGFGIQHEPRVTARLNP